MTQFRAFLSLMAFFAFPLLDSAQEMHSTARTIPAFDQLKALVGTWIGADSSGHKIEVTYELISNGSVLMERLKPGNEPDMITMYSLEGDRIQVTHYCSAGNQPTMQTVPSPLFDGKIAFTFMRLSGAKSPDEGHMVGLTVSIPDKNHLTQSWTFMEKGKSNTETFTYTRKS